MISQRIELCRSGPRSYSSHFENQIFCRRASFIRLEVTKMININIWLPQRILWYLPLILFIRRFFSLRTFFLEEHSPFVQILLHIRGIFVIYAVRAFWRIFLCFVCIFLLLIYTGMEKNSIKRFFAASKKVDENDDDKRRRIEPTAALSNISIPPEKKSVAINSNDEKVESSSKSPTEE